MRPDMSKIADSRLDENPFRDSVFEANGTPE
jgi:hypothetical protein